MNVNIVDLLKNEVDTMMQIFIKMLSLVGFVKNVEKSLEIIIDH
jgi:hypothetical protein